MSYEDLEIWKRSRQLSVEVYRSMSNCQDWGFRDQLTRSCLSIPSNIAEGFERERPKEIAQFLRVAKGSCGEARTQISIGQEIGYVDANDGSRWTDECRQLSRMIAALIRRHTD